MQRKFKLISLVVVALSILLIPTVALAGTGGTVPELIFPGSYTSCDPSDSITVTNIPKDFYVVFNFYHNGGVIGSETVTSTGGNVSVDFPYGDLSGSFSVVAKIYSPTGLLKMTLKGNWEVICEKPPSGFQGCTPGYWKQSQHFDSWVGYSTSDKYEDVFSVDYVKTLLQALKTGGGAEKALGRHSVAALLNASNPDVNYAYSTSQIIAMVQAAFANGNFEYVKNQLAYQNELGCPLH